MTGGAASNISAVSARIGLTDTNPGRTGRLTNRNIAASILGFIFHDTKGVSTIGSTARYNDEDEWAWYRRRVTSDAVSDRPIVGRQAEGLRISGGIDVIGVCVTWCWSKAILGIGWSGGTVIAVKAGWVGAVVGIV